MKNQVPARKGKDICRNAKLFSKHTKHASTQWYFLLRAILSSSVYYSLISLSSFNRRTCSPVCFPSCCVSRHLHGGQTLWWNMQKTSWPSTPSTWMPPWRSSHLRAGTAFPFSSCSMTSSGQIVSSCSWPIFMFQLPSGIFI